jgi:hypothetical protein
MRAPAVDIDTLVEAAELAGLAGTVPTVWLVAQNPRMAAVVGSRDASWPRRAKSLPWSQAVDDFLKANLGYLSDADMARELGRTRVAVHLRWKRDLRLTPPTKSPGWTTPNRVARALNIDGHSVMRLVRQGILPVEPLPWLNHGIYNAYRLRIVTFYRWAINPQHWIYFRIERVRDPHLRRLLQLKAARWGDAWLTPGQVAAMHGVTDRDVNRYIRAGRLPAVDWGNWRILRSNAERVRFAKGRGAGHEYPWSPAADAFMLLARAIGLSTNAIGALVGLPHNTVSYRLHDLCAAPAQVSRIAHAHGLQDLQINTAGQLFADWRLYRQRFPAVARALNRFAAGQRVRAADLLYVRGVLWAWAMWHATTDEQQRFAYNLAFAGNATHGRLVAALSELRSWGIDPLDITGGAE